jgi:hypothetical protein
MSPKMTGVINIQSLLSMEQPLFSGLGMSWVPSGQVPLATVK